MPPLQALVHPAWTVAKRPTKLFAIGHHRPGAPGGRVSRSPGLMVAGTGDHLLCRTVATYVDSSKCRRSRQAARYFGDASDAEQGTVPLRRNLVRARSTQRGVPKAIGDVVEGLFDCADTPPASVAL